MDPVTSAGGGGGLSYPDSVDSSPRSRGGESWDEPFPSSAASAASQKLRLMCSFGGRIVPRPTDKSLCYLGGETRIVVVDRLSSLSDLHSKLSRSLLNSRPFTMKYQLPNEDLDSLISVTTDEDLDNMIEEYDRIASASVSSSTNSAAPNSGSAKSSRIRLFLFPTKPESAPSSIGSLLDDSKSETWFVDALNGAMGIGIDGLPRGLSTDSASVNCLLGLEDDSSVHSRAGVGSNVGGDPREQSDRDRDPDRMVLPRPDSSGKLGRHGQDVHSVPDSPMLETTSSFGSTSSVPSLSNLPPIRVRADDRPPDPRYGNLEDHFQQMNLSSAVPPPAMNPPPQIPMPTAAGSTPQTVSPTENPNPNRVFGSEEEKPDIRKQPPMPQQVVVNQQQQQQQKSVQLEAPISDSRPVYYQERMPPPTAVNLEPKREVPVSDPAAAYRMQQVPVPESGYVMSTIPAPQQLHQQQLHPQQHQQQLHQQQLQQQQLHPQQQQQQQLHPQQQQQQQLHPQQQQQQPQFIPANPQFVQMPSYYQVPHPMHQAQQFDPTVPMYYLPVRQNPPAVSAMQMPKVTPKPELQPNLYRTAGPSAPMTHMAAQPADQGHPAYTNMGYHVMHHHHPSQAPAPTAVAAAPPPQMANYGYEYTNATAATVDTMHQAQVYYTQATSPPSMQAQYQTVISEAAQQTVDVKQNRAS